MILDRKAKGPEQCCRIAQGRQSGCARSGNQLHGCLWHILWESRIFGLKFGVEMVLPRIIHSHLDKEDIMGGRGTYAAGNDVPYQYKTVGVIDGVKVLEPIDPKASRRLPEEAHSSRAYIKLDPSGKFSQYREYNDKHELVLEIAYHPEINVFHDGDNGPTLHAHDYSNTDKGNSWHKPARALTVSEFEKYKKYFVGLSDAELKHQKEKLK